MKHIYFIFTGEVIREHFFHKFLKKGFWHVFTMGPIGLNNQLLEINGGNDFEITMYEKYGDISVENAMQVIKDGAPEWKILMVDKSTLEKKFKMRHPSNWIPTCVNFSKIVSGFNSWALTPYQLYKSLLSAGAIELKRSSLEKRIKIRTIRNSLVEGNSITS